MIFRRFADLPHRQVHYRETGAGDATPLLLCHSSPGSAKQLEGLMRAIGPGRRLIAPDRPGNGDSPALDNDAPDFADYARDTIAFLDAIGLEKVSVYGTHTGTGIAMELAILAPERIDRVILNGIACFTAEECAYLTEHYAPPFPPDLDGAYLLKAFFYCRDQNVFWPWFERSREAARINGLASASSLHEWLLEVLKASTTYPLGYHAAFRYNARARLALIPQRTLVLAGEDDMLRDISIAVAPLLPDGDCAMLPRYDDPGYLRRTAKALTDFIDG